MLRTQRTAGSRNEEFCSSSVKRTRARPCPEADTTPPWTSGREAGGHGGRGGVGKAVSGLSPRPCSPGAVPPAHPALPQREGPDLGRTRQCLDSLPTLLPSWGSPAVLQLYLRMATVSASGELAQGQMTSWRRPLLWKTLRNASQEEIDPGKRGAGNQAAGLGRAPCSGTCFRAGVQPHAGLGCAENPAQLLSFGAVRGGMADPQARAPNALRSGKPACGRGPRSVADVLRVQHAGSQSQVHPALARAGDAAAT